MEILERLQLEYAALDIKLFEIGGTSVTVATLTVLLIILAATWVASSVVQRGLERGFKMRSVKDEGTIGVTKRLTHYLILIVGLGIGLQTVGINLSALFAAGAVFAIGLGFAMQNMAKNFFGGLILLLEGSIKPGSILAVEDRLVKVKKLGIRSTIARTLDEEDLIIPNANIVEATVKNYTLSDTQLRLRCPVGVVYSADMRQVRKVLETVAREVPWRMKDREPVILLTDFGSSSVDWEVSLWIDEPWLVRRRRSDLNESLWFALKDAGITIAFPQLDVHFDPPVMDLVDQQRAAS